MSASTPRIDPLPQAIWHALTTAHSHLALTRGHARRYPAAIAPFAALDPDQPPPAALDDLLPLLAPSESVYLLGSRPPTHPQFQHDGIVPCLQMIFPPLTPLPPTPSSPHSIEPLTCADAPAMLALIAVAYPGYFRSETCRMGRYWGVRDPTDDALLAMGGERLVLSPPGQPAWHEISGLCVHPTRAAGQGLGTALLTHILAQHRAEGARSWLHVTDTNTRAISLYHRLGFVTTCAVALHRLERVSPELKGREPQTA